MAWNPSTPVPVLEELAKDEDGYVRLSLALNPSTPGPVLEAPANGDDEYVRREAQGSLDALRAAAVDPAGRVRIAPARGTDGIEH